MPAQPTYSFPALLSGLLVLYLRCVTPSVFVIALFNLCMLHFAICFLDANYTRPLPGWDSLEPGETVNSGLAQ